jgi:hypothetical protein
VPLNTLAPMRTCGRLCSLCYLKSLFSSSPSHRQEPGWAFFGALELRQQGIERGGGAEGPGGVGASQGVDEAHIWPDGDGALWRQQGSKYISSPQIRM